MVKDCFPRSKDECFHHCSSFFNSLFICFWLSWVFIATYGFSLVVASKGYSLLCIRASHCGGFSCCKAQGLGYWLQYCSMQAQQLLFSGLLAPWYMKSSQTGDWTCVPCIGGRILIYCTAWEVHHCSFFHHLFFNIVVKILSRVIRQDIEIGKEEMT